VHAFALPGNQKIEATLAGEFSASRYLTVDYTQASNAAGYVMGDASVAYVNPHRWEVTGFVRNFNNATVYTGAYTLPSLFRSLTLANVGAPRTYGIRLAAHF
jgi:iron complex outermembrane recepter protein